MFLEIAFSVSVMESTSDSQPEKNYPSIKLKTGSALSLLWTVVILLALSCGTDSSRNSEANWRQSGNRQKDVIGHQDGRHIRSRAVSLSSPRLRYDTFSAKRWRRAHSQKQQYTWSNWSDWLPCSQSCGIGVTNRTRYCTRKRKHNKEVAIRFCTGDPVQHKLCNIQDCDVIQGDRRETQCEVFNKIHHEGKYYRWKPLSQESMTDGGFPPCSLVCQADDYPFHVTRKFSDSVPDGTTCQINNTDGICIKTKCIPIGCDKTLHSTRTIDICGVCDGKNRTCDVREGELSQTINYGYTTVFVIPEKSRNIEIRDQGGAAAVFALRSDHGIYFVNGKLASTYPTVYDGVGGTNFLYYHPMYSTGGVEQLQAAGPTNETLYVMMLSSEQSTDIILTYKYSVPKTRKRARKLPSTRAPPIFLPHSDTQGIDDLHGNLLSHDMSHHIVNQQDLITSGSQSGSNAGQHNDVSSYTGSQRHNNTIPSYLGTNNYPDDRFQERLHHLSRDTHDAYYWKTNMAAHCSATCDNGVQTEYAQCTRRVDGQIVDDGYCDQRRRPNSNTIKCTGQPCPPRWSVGEWGSCSTRCGEGIQTRSIRCWRLLAPGFDSSVLPDMCRDIPKPNSVRRCSDSDCGPVWEMTQWNQCSSKCGHGIQKRVVRCSSSTQSCDLSNKPISFQQCSSGPCFNKWVVSKWSLCSGACGSGLMYRRVSCVDPGGQFLEDEHCDHTRRPLSVQACGDQPNCEPAWVAQTWGKCSVECGDGLISRDVVCGEVINSGFKIEQEQKCSHLYKPATRSRCREQACPPQWFTSEWTDCSQTCGPDGIRTRTVSCYADEVQSSACDMNNKPNSRESCNTASCRSQTDDQDQLNNDNTEVDAISRTRECSEQTSEGYRITTSGQNHIRTEPSPCVDKDGIDCRDVVLRQGCAVTRYRNLCCLSCKNQRIATNQTNYRVPRSVNLIQQYKTFKSRYILKSDIILQTEDSNNKIST